MNKPLYKCFVFPYRSGVVAKDVDAEVLEVLSCQCNVGQYVLAAFSFCAAE